ncbi:hypothetical protein IBB3154_0654 [Ligilactobacillus salivarius]|uniref:hypothetical protein n=1 Tax=Ligilactobacillus salivarius TaxID=1624 RepID=UPI0013DE0535|nr:hypothetical protein [Ligilactobacillus salivarius]QIG36145.1 hypothetical protein IBB3154_0654 [Ligilactobacillus salivarius]
MPNKDDTIEKFNVASDTEKNLLLPAVLATIVFTKKYFKANKELKKFTSDTLNINYKNYLFLSRTALYARIVKDFYLDIEKQKFLKTQLITFVEEKSTSVNNNHQKKKTSQNDVIAAWRKVINPND